MTPGIKATLVMLLGILGVCGIAGLILYKPIWILGGVCIWMIYLLWRDLYRFFSGQNGVNKLKQ